MLAWNWQRTHANAGIVDVVWAFGMMFAGLWYAFTGSAPLLLRLSLGITDRFAGFCAWATTWRVRVFNEAEDGRYHAMRKAMEVACRLDFCCFFCYRPDLFGFYPCHFLPLHKIPSHITR